RGYASVILVGLVLHTVTVKWQPWGNRLFLYLVVLAAPLAGLALAAVFDRAGAPARPGPARQAGRVRRPLLAGLLVLALTVGGVAGGLSARYGPPRPPVGSPFGLLPGPLAAPFVVRSGPADPQPQGRPGGTG